MNKKILLILFFLGISIFVYTSYINHEKNQESEKLGKNISKDDYMYKEDLLDLGYNIEEINIIQSKINNSNVKDYLLNKKYDNLTKFISCPYFDAKNIERYENYYNSNSNYSFDEIVLYVNIGLDYEFYTNINELEKYKEVTTLVNKYNKLPDDYSFDDLITLEKPYSNDGTKQIRKVAYDSLIKMIDDAKKENINLFVVSGYRTNEKQESLFNNSVNKNGLNHALLYSAKKGHSEHQLGLAVDLVSVENSFENTKEYKWLKQNAYKYGFIERYPKGKEFITGYGYEPWHYRYLGIEISTKIYQENITYEEYVVKYL